MFFSNEQLQDALKEFKEECIELLDRMEEGLMTIQENGPSHDEINAVFRAAHTIKGSAGMFKLNHLVEFTHVAENLLDEIRNDNIAFNHELIALLLQSKDHMLEMVLFYSQNFGQEPDEVIRASSKSIIDSLQYHLNNDISVAEEGKPAEKSGWHVEILFGTDLFEAGMDPSNFIRYLTRFGTIEHFDLDTALIGNISNYNPKECKIKCEFDLNSSISEAEILDVFEFIIDDIEIRLTQCLPDNSNDVDDDFLSDHEQLSESSTNIVEVSSGMVVDSAKSQVTSSSLRVDSDKIDVLINLIGEMVIANANVVQKSSEIKNNELMQSVSIVSHMLEEIRECAMKIRMVQIGDTFNKFKRIIHDVSKNLGKEVELVISGGDTELDKTLVEKINDPLIHIVRNALDHGLESGEERVLTNKRAKGRIELNAFHDAGMITIQISDDGRGLDEEKIFNKAVEKGILDPHSKLSQKEIFNLIFEPGFSTAEKVTDLSGRGVGMDVVRKNIQSLRGSVDISSSKGKGSVFTIRLPLTLAIIDGFLVRVGQTHYVIPLEMVLECVEYLGEDNDEYSGNNYINLRGTILPLLSIRSHFSETHPKNTEEKENVVVVRSGENRFGVIVDELLGEFQTVIKPLGKIYRGVRGIGGSTILGTGEVALIIDIPMLINVIGSEHHYTDKKG